MECEPFELQPVDLVLGKLYQRREFRPYASVSRNVLSECLLELRRRRKHDINLEEVGISRQLERQSRGGCLHIPAERKDDKRIDSKVSERVDCQNQILTSTSELRIPNRVGSPRMKLSINLVFPTHNAPLNNTGRVP